MTPEDRRRDSTFAGEEVARHPVMHDYRDPHYEEERAAREGFGAARHWGGYGSDRVERGFAERVGDEVRAWFGDEDAARRRLGDKAGSTD
jgi:hypothetical protein